MVLVTGAIMGMSPGYNLGIVGSLWGGRVNERTWKLLEHPSFLGVTFLLSWILLLFYSSIPSVSFSSSVEYMSIAYLSSTVTMSATVLFGAFFVRNRWGILSSKVVIIGASIAMSIGTMLCLYSGVTGSFAFGLAGGVVTGVSSGLVTLQWAGAFRPIGSFPAIMCIPAVVLASTGISRTILYLPATLMYPLICVLPLLSCATCVFAANKYAEVDEEAVVTDSSQVRIYVSFFVVVMLFGFANGTLDQLISAYNYTAIFYMAVTVLALVATGYLTFKYARKQLFPYVTAPVLLLVMLLAPVFTLESEVANAQLVTTGELAIEALLFLLAIAFANYYSVRSIATYALARVGLASGSALGWYVASQIPAILGDSAGSSLGLIFSVIGVLIIAVWLVTTINNSSKTPFEDEQDLTAEAALPEPEQAPARSIDDLCDEVATRHGISPRELDVLRLLARGYTASKIQSDLFIAPGTVNYHTRNIYVKLGVHSKQELINYVNAQ